MLSVELDPTDPRLAALRAGLRAAGIDWVEREVDYYSPGELLSKPLLSLFVSVEGEAAAPEYGTCYDLSGACKTCGTGARQASSLHVPAGALPPSAEVCRLWTREILLREPLATELEGRAFRGVELWQVYEPGGRTPLPWRQLLVTGPTLPRMGDRTEGIKARRQCPDCVRDGFFHTPKRPPAIRYRRSEVSPGSLPEFVQTWECFGRSVLRDDPRKCRFATPQIIVRPVVCEFFAGAGIAAVQFHPVELQEEVGR